MEPIAAKYRYFTAGVCLCAKQALQDELERSRLELEQAVKEKDSTIAAKDKEISQV